MCQFLSTLFLRIIQLRSKWTENVQLKIRDLDDYNHIQMMQYIHIDFDTVISFNDKWQRIFQLWKPLYAIHRKQRRHNSSLLLIFHWN